MCHLWMLPVYLLSLAFIQGEARPVGVPTGQLNNTLEEPSLDDRLNLGTQYFSLNSTLGCAVQAKDYNVPEDIAKLVTEKTKLLEFEFTFEEYATNPLREDMFIAYKGNQWTLATTSQGKTILALAFDYGALSMMTLEFGVERMDIVLRDEPKGCLGNLSESDKVEVMTLAGMRHYGGPDQSVVIQPSQSLCHQVVQNRWGFALFTYQCCHLQVHSQLAECTINEGNNWLTVVDILLLSVRVIALFTIVTEILAMVVRRSLVHVPYVIKRDVPLKMLLKILRVNVDERIKIKSIEDEGEMMNMENGDAESQMSRKPQARFAVQTPEGTEMKCEMALDLRKEQGFKRYKEFLEEQERKHGELPETSGQVGDFNSTEQQTPKHRIQQNAMEVQMDRLHIAVDYDRLQEENDIPVGFFRSIYEAVFACGLRNVSTFEQCCKTRILKVCSDNSKLHWIHFFEPLGKVLLVLLVPTVFYIRIAFFYVFEEEEVSYRAGRARLVGLPIAPNKFNLIDYVKPTDPLFIVIYTLYISTILLVAYLSVVGDRNKFTHIITTTFMDIQQTHSSKVIMHFLKTLTLPFTMFGIVGCLIFPSYMLLVVPFILIIHIFYMLPLVYFTERMISNSSKYLHKERLNIKKKCLPIKADEKTPGSLIEAFAELFPHKEVKEMREKEEKKLGRVRKFEKSKRISCMRKLLRVVAVIMIIATMYGMSLLAAECVGFLAEMGTFTLMGIMINAGVYLKFVSLALLILVYCHTCFSGVHKKYLKLNKSLFQSIKRLMSNDIAEVTAQEEAYQENTAFKAESVRDNLERAKKAKAAEKERAASKNLTKPDETLSEEASNEHHPLLLQEGLPDMADETAIECSDDSEDDSIVPKRHWLLNDVIFFIDKHDTPRIPQLLFEEVCKVDVDGSPGPVHESMFNSLKKLLTIILFLLFVFILISSFGAVYNVSSTNQMLATLAGGLLPLLMRTFMTPAVDSMELNSVSFENKLNQILKNMKQVWPIYDLELKEAVQEDELGEGEDTKDANTIENGQDKIQEEEERKAAGAVGLSAGLSEKGKGNNTLKVDTSTEVKKEETGEIGTVAHKEFSNQINNNGLIASTSEVTQDMEDIELKTIETVKDELQREPDVVHLVVISCPPSSPMYTTTTA